MWYLGFRKLRLLSAICSVTVRWV